ncbi:hypothetical protein [Streptomyces sp. NPDC020917]|uniref:hypothetical protein n=1 Tax=Streptomyces sp. NPDC020917 TaxID=3365102 RepID=UPI00379A8443
MDDYEGPATLEWWANRSTCLGDFPVHVTVRVAGDRWTCQASLNDPPADGGREAFAFLMALDPVFTLRFAEDSALLVDVTENGDGYLELTAFEPVESQGTRRLWV